RNCGYSVLGNFGLACLDAGVKIPDQGNIGVHQAMKCDSQVRVDLQALLELTGSLLVTPQASVHNGEIVVCLREIGVEADQNSVVFDRLLEIALDRARMKCQ